MLEVEMPLHALDLGCGRGRIAIQLARFGIHVTAVDCSTRFITQINEQAVRNKLPLCGVVADIIEYRPSIEFDLVVLSFVLHLIPKHDRTKVLCNVRQLTQTQGLNLFMGFNDRTIANELNEAYLLSNTPSWEIIEDLVFNAQTISGNLFAARSLIITRSIPSSNSSSRMAKTFAIASMITSSITQQTAS